MLMLMSTPGLHGLSYAYVYACAYVVRVNQALVLFKSFCFDISQLFNLLHVVLSLLRLPSATNTQFYLTDSKGFSGL